jgi:undecaprenyl-diphosphatase
MDPNIEQPLKREGLAAAFLSFGMAIAVASLVLFAWLAGEVFDGGADAVDSSVREAVHTIASPHLTTLMIFISFLGSTIFLTLASVVIDLVFVIKRRYRSAILFAAVMLGSSFLNYALKITFARVRPVPYFDLPPPASFSFPSGHALCSACFYGIAAWLISTRSRSPAVKGIVWSAALLMIFAVGLSRIYLGVHFPSDVAAGYTTASFWIFTVMLADSAIANRRSSRVPI